MRAGGRVVGWRERCWLVGLASSLRSDASLRPIQPGMARRLLTLSAHLACRPPSSTSSSSSSSSTTTMTIAQARIGTLYLSPPLINSSSPWASDLDQLKELYDAPSTGGVTTRTATLGGFDEDSAVHNVRLPLPDRSTALPEPDRSRAPRPHARSLARKVRLPPPGQHDKHLRLLAPSLELLPRRRPVDLAREAREHEADDRLCVSAAFKCAL